MKPGPVFVQRRHITIIIPPVSPQAGPFQVRRCKLSPLENKYNKMCRITYLQSIHNTLKLFKMNLSHWVVWEISLEIFYKKNILVQLKIGMQIG